MTKYTVAWFKFLDEKIVHEDKMHFIIYLIPSAFILALAFITLLEAAFVNNYLFLLLGYIVWDVIKYSKVSPLKDFKGLREHFKEALNKEDE